MKHTPGPWRVSKSLRYIKGRSVQSILGDSDGVTSVVVCDMPLEYEPTHAAYPKMMADAILISAAPELLKAVKQAIDDLDDIKTLINSGNVPDNINKSIALKIRDLCTIADKAEGRG